MVFSIFCGCGGAGGKFDGLVSYICKTYLCTPRNIIRGNKNEGARDVWQIQRSPSRLLSSMVECKIVPEDTYAITILDNYGLQVYNNTLITPLLFIVRLCVYTVFF